MQDGVALERKTKEELKQIAQGLEIEKISALRKDEIIERIRAKRKQLEEKKNAQQEQPKRRERPADVVEVRGILDVMGDGFGFLRVANYSSSRGDIYVSPVQIQRFNLKTGDEIIGDCRPSPDADKYAPLIFVKKINGDSIDVALKRRPFEYLTPIYPTEKLRLDSGVYGGAAAKLIDIIAPIGKGQRGMIVAPPKAGKTTLIKTIANAITKNHPEVKLIVLLIDERPEEVTDIRESIDGDVVFSTFDQMPENHCKVSEMVLERAMRLVEQKKDVVILLDSITRLARANNLTVAPTGRTLSGGLDPDALYKPKKFFGAARNIREGGSLTVLATALVETGSRMDDVIFEEFKGTGNMELKLDRGLQERRIFPAIDIVKSGTRREESLLTNLEREAAWLIRREAAKVGSAEVMAMLLKMIRTVNNTHELSETIIKYYGKG